MPSLPTSLIVVGLVVAWLVVLVPMVARRREEVPENNEESANFRVLQRNSSAGRRRPIFSRTAMAHRSRPDAGDLDDASDEYDMRIEYDDDAPQGDDRDGQLVTKTDHRSSVDAHGGGAVDSDTRVGSRAPVDSHVRADAVGRDDDVVRVSAEARRDARPAEGTGRNAGTRVTAIDESDEPGMRYQRVGGARSARRPTDDVSRGEAEGPLSDRDADGGEFRRTPIRRGRGGFDPAAADRAQAYRFRQRQRVALALLLIAVAGVVAGLLGVGYGYAAAVGGGALLMLYLAYLRRQVRIEAEIRGRREARLARARQIRPGYRPSVAEQVYAHRTGETPRPGSVGEYRVTSHAHQSVPPTGFGYGEPVDLEDSDPAFDDLEYYRPAAYGRRAG